MKRIWFLAILLFPVMIFSQSFSALEGMEDQFGNTHLFYRIYNNIGIVNDSITNCVYHWNLAANTDSLYFFDYDDSPPTPISPYSFDITKGFKFFNNNPDQYIRWGAQESMDIDNYIEKYNNPAAHCHFACLIVTVEFKNNDTLYAGTSYKLARSTDGGGAFDYIPNASMDFIALKYDPSGKFFGTNGPNRLAVSTDEGVSFSVVDTANGSIDPVMFDQISLDKNPAYKYRLITLRAGSVLRVSNNNGNAFSWSTKYESNNKLYFAQDNNQQGSIYLADGKNILHSYNYGESWSVVWQSNANIVGLYKKSGTDKLYAATGHAIIAISSDSVRVIKRFPTSANDLSYNPLEIGTKLIYNVHEMANTWPTPYDNKYKFSMEVVKDTTLANGKVYKQIKNTKETNNYTFFEYQRIDSTNGIIYRFLDANSDEIVEDLSAAIGDTTYNKRMEGFMLSIGTLFNNTGTTTLFGQLRKTRNYTANGFGIRTYRLAQGIGIDSLTFGIEELYGVYTLTGMIKNGVIYGDTTMITGVESNNAIVNDYRLEQNYPNPFNPATNINFSLAKGDKVEIIVYDVLGNKIATLLEGYKPAGNHSIQFNAKNLPSGVYIYRIKSGAFMASKKMMLVK